MNKWIELYNKKVPAGFKRDERFTLFYSQKKGFAEIADTGKMVVVNQVCGDLKFWRKFTERLVRQLGYTHAGTITCRPILPFLRLSGVSVDDVEETEFGNRYFFTDKRTAKKGRASPTDEGSYCVTWEVGADEI